MTDVVAGNTERLDWAKGDGLLPAIVQDARSSRVLMLGYMSVEAVRQTLESGLVTFHSRSRNQLWQKGKPSGHVLRLREIRADCDMDTLLIPMARPVISGRQAVLPRAISRTSRSSLTSLG
jgi:phosphoribosyl-ATP pyrophosphohydrolase/phosphoribosyl-AMP cyclohydrolase